MTWPFRAEPSTLGPPLKYLVSEDDRRQALDGAVVMCFHCDGCMAHDHKFQWIGIVEAFVRLNNSEYLSARVKLVKRANRDWRDAELGYEHITVADTSLQHLGPKLFCWYK